MKQKSFCANVVVDTRNAYSAAEIHNINYSLLSVDIFFCFCQEHPDNAAVGNANSDIIMGTTKRDSQMIVLCADALMFVVMMMMMRIFIFVVLQCGGDENMFLLLNM